MHRTFKEGAEESKRLHDEMLADPEYSNPKQRSTIRITREKIEIDIRGLDPKPTPEELARDVEFCYGQFLSRIDVPYEDVTDGR